MYKNMSNHLKYIEIYKRYFSRKLKKRHSNVLSSENDAAAKDHEALSGLGVGVGPGSRGARVNKIKTI